ncbi:MAG: serine recombinase, partial [Myxococcota bacterium]
QVDQRLHPLAKLHHPLSKLCVGDQMRGSDGICLSFGGVRVDRAVAAQLLAAVEPHAIEAAAEAARRARELNEEVRRAFARELEETEYEAKLAARRHEAVDPDKRLVARELEARWEAALESVRSVEEKIAAAERRAATHPPIDQEKLLRLAHDLPAVWNAPTSDMRMKQRLVRIVIHEVIADRDEEANEIALTIHWAGGQHTEIRVARVRSGRYPADRRPSAATAIRKLGGRWPDRQLAVTMNRMRCRTPSGGSWTTVRVRELRERLGIAEFDPSAPREETISRDEAARRLSISVPSVDRLIRKGVLPASQIMPSAPWEIPIAALDSEAVRIGVRGIIDRRPRNFAKLQDSRTLRLPGT